jgi:hypothetical protein
MLTKLVKIIDKRTVIKPIGYWMIKKACGAKIIVHWQ